MITLAAYAELCRGLEPLRDLVSVAVFDDQFTDTGREGAIGEARFGPLKAGGLPTTVYTDLRKADAIQPLERGELVTGD